MEVIDSVKGVRKMIQVLKEKIEANTQSINEEINQVWQSEEEKKPVADKSVFDKLVNI